MLHFKDFKKALYGEGNYRLYGKYAKYSVARSQVKSLNSVDRETKFTDFVKNKKCVKEDKNDVKSSYSDFKERCKETKTELKSKKVENEKFEECKRLTEEDVGILEQD